MTAHTYALTTENRVLPFMDGCRWSRRTAVRVARAVELKGQLSALYSLLYHHPYDRIWQVDALRAQQEYTRLLQEIERMSK